MNDKSVNALRSRTYEEDQGCRCCALLDFGVCGLQKLEPQVGQITFWSQRVLYKEHKRLITGGTA